jgi:UDP-glucose 4-epimerase
VAERGVDTLEGKTVLVVGSSGFLGRTLVQRLAERKARVVGMSRHAAGGQQSEYISEWPGDASDIQVLQHAFGTIRPDIVFHLTTDGSGALDLDLVPSTLRNDVVATVNSLYCAASAEHKVERFVITASLEEPQVRHEPGIGRPAEPTPTSPYAAAKWAATAYGWMFRQVYGLDVRIVRSMMSYGPAQKTYKVVPSTILSLLRGEPARIGSGSRRVDWVYVDDVIDGMLAAALASDLEETVDLGTGTLMTVAELAQEIARQIGRPDLLEIGSGARGREVERAADVATARQLIGFSARVPLSEGLGRTIAWYRERLEQGRL